jgi:hypothetical protein
VLSKFAKDANLSEARADLTHVMVMLGRNDGNFRHHMAATIAEIGER